MLDPPRARPDLLMAPAYDGQVIVSVGESGRRVRLSQPSAWLLRGCDGTRSITELAAAGTATSPEDVAWAVERFAQLGLLLDPAVPPVADTVERLASGRLRFHPPSTLTFAVVDSERLGQVLARPSRWVMVPGVQAVIWTMSLLGIAVVLTTAADWGRDFSQPVALVSAVAAGGILVCVTILHELAHAGSLAVRDGTVGRMGVMLFYGTPALFCDVTDAWRLAPHDRVRVALAGVRTHLLAAALAAIVAVLVQGGPIHEVAFLIAAGGAWMAVVNLFPLVKLDGYIALIGWLDTPHLRSRSIAEARDAFRYVVFGGERPAAVGSSRVLFGAASAIAGPALVLIVLLHYQSVVLSVASRPGAVLLGVIYVGFVVFMIRGLARAARAARTVGASRGRVALPALALAAAAYVAAFVVEVPSQQRSVFFGWEGETYVTAPPGAILQVGQPLRMRAAGVLLRPELGTGVVCSPPTLMPVRVDAGSNVLLPFVATRVQPAARVCGASHDHTEGLAEFESAPKSVVQWAYSSIAGNGATLWGE